MKRHALLPVGLASLALLAASIAPACSQPGEEDADVEEGGDAYSYEGTCDGLPKLKNVKTPPGVCVGVVATGFTYARGITQLPSGDLVLAEMGGWAQDRGKVWLLHRKADKTWEKKVLLQQIDKPSGVAVGPDGLPYVGTPKDIFRFDPYVIDPRLGQPRIKLVVRDLPGTGRHPLAKFAFDPKKPWTLYVNVGSASDTCEQGAGVTPPAGYPLPCPESDGASPRGVLRKYDLSGADHVPTGFSVMAKGLRNSMALAVHPRSGALLQAENSRDSINKHAPALAEQEGELPHEELNVIQDGAHYGWPYCYDNGAPNPEYLGRVDCSRYANPALLLPGHASPLGMAYYEGNLFPAPYRGNLLVAYHGYRANGHRLVMVPVDENGIPGSGEPLDVIRGWEKSADGKDPQGAPVDVLVAKDGSIFLTEDKNGTVLRVFFDASAGSGQPMRPEPPKQPTANPEEAQRCGDLARRTDPFAAVQRDVIDQACVSCHGVGPGYAGGLRLDKCDAVGNAQRLTAARSGGRAPYVVPRDLGSELLKRLRGDGYPQMPAGGVTPEQLDEVESWVSAGAPVPR